jgi:hypothetical protein
MSAPALRALRQAYKGIGGMGGRGKCAEENGYGRQAAAHGGEDIGGG